MENEVAKLLKPLREALNNNREVVRHLPKADPGQGVWKKFAAWLTADGRQERKMQQHAQMKQHESALIESRIKQIEAYYKIETFQKLKKLRQQDSQREHSFVCALFAPGC